MTTAYLNRIATRVPQHEVHGAFVRFAHGMLDDRRDRALFDRIADKERILSRFSVLAPAPRDGQALDADRLYVRGRFPSTGQRMRAFETYAPGLAAQTVADLDLGADATSITHVIVTSCTGLYAPGLDHDIVERCGLDPSVERTMVGFMGCYAAINALRLARHVVRSEPEARVLLVNLELCSLHHQETKDVERMLSFLVFADGCSASIISADPIGLALDRFHSVVVPGTRDLIRWNIRDQGFDMHLSGRVPGAIGQGLKARAREVLAGALPEAIDRWAVHPGGRAILDAVEQGLELPPSALAASRSVLERFGNMSSASILFVLKTILDEARAGDHGCCMSFGPGLTAETMLFRKV